MINQEKVKPEYSFMMAPYYYIDNDKLLKNQLINLNFQKNKNFEVIIPDPHYKKRSYLKEFVSDFDFNVVHFPYISHLYTPKSFDYGILNDASLMASTNKLVTFQDWRFCHPLLVDLLKKFHNSWFVGFLWQLYGYDHPRADIKINYTEAERILDQGVFPNISCSVTETHTFDNPSWGHYCINKNLWMEVNGIDEVVTNTKHYADLDLYIRLENCYKSKAWSPTIPLIKNCMLRLHHQKGNYFGFSHVPLDYEVKQTHLSCCFVNTDTMNDKDFTWYVFEKIKTGDFIKLYETPYSDKFKKNHHNPSLDNKLCTFGFQCRRCGIIGETPHWYEKSSDARISSLIGKGLGAFQIGRNLNKIAHAMMDKSFEEKVAILRNSWYDKYFLS